MTGQERTDERNGMGTETGAPAVTAYWTRRQLEEATSGFIERHWPKNDTAAQGGPATPGRGEAMAMVGMFLAELPDLIPGEADTAVDTPPAPGTSTSDPGGAEDATGEPVIDMGYLSLPGEVQQAIEVGLAHSGDRDDRDEGGRGHR